MGIARAYVHVDAPFSYEHWIDGIRQGRTFTTSGPLIFLQVNEAGIGDVLAADPQQPLRIRARVMSRDPIGTLQIVSNGRVLSSHDTQQTELEVEIEVPAEQSRWIVARCSNRTDGRADFGFGNFNAITGPGIAHTSPVYVQVDGMPRFDPLAADFWKERMRIHADEIRTRGRFANDAQLDEAVGYVERGIEMFEDLKQQVPLARSATETFPQFQRRLINIVRRLETSQSSIEDALQKAITPADVRQVVGPLILLTGTVTADGRLQLTLPAPRVKLTQGRPQRFLVAIENPTAVTGRLQLDACDVNGLASTARPAAEWCRFGVVDSPFSSAFLTGAAREFKVIEVLAHQAGKRELGLSGWIGSATDVPSSPVTSNVRLTLDVSLRGRHRTLSPHDNGP